MERYAVYFSQYGLLKLLEISGPPHFMAVAQAIRSAEGDYSGASYPYDVVEADFPDIPQIMRNRLAKKLGL